MDYATSFATDESPLSESGRWKNLNAWFTQVQASGGNALATIPVPQPDGEYIDSIAFLEGMGFAPDQYACAHIRKTASGGYRECELLLRFKHVDHSGQKSPRGYECYIHHAGNYVSITRWSGAAMSGPADIGYFEVNDGSPFTAPEDGDFYEAWIIGTIITIRLRGEVLRVFDVSTFSGAVFTDGDPGIGFDCGSSGAESANDTFGFKDFAARDTNMPITVPRTGGGVNTSGNATHSESFGSLPSAGSGVVALVYLNDDRSTSALAVSDNQGGSTSDYVASSVIKFTGSDGYTEYVQAFLRNNITIPSPGNPFTLTVQGGNGGNTYWGLGIAELVLAGATFAFEGAAEASDGATGSTDPATCGCGPSGAGTVASSVALALLTYGGYTGPSANIATPAGFTSLLLENDGGSTAIGSLSYKIRTATGAETVSWGTNIDPLGGPGQWAGLIAIINAVVGGTADLAGGATASASATAALNKGVHLVGAAVASAVGAAALTHQVPLVAAATAGATAIAALGVGKPLQGAAIAAAVGGGGLHLDIHLGGAAFAQAVAAAQMTHLVPLAGGATADASGSGTLSTAGSVDLSGAATAGATAAAILSLTIHLSGDAIAAAAASGAMSHGVPLAGAASAAAIAAGALIVSVRLSGNAIASATGSGELLGSVSLAGNAQAGATAGATLSLVVPLTAQAVADAMATGQLSLQIPLQASAIAQAIATGALSVANGQSLSGDAIAAAVGGGSLTVLRSLFGQAVASAQGSAGLTVNANILLSGNAIARASAAATLSGGDALLPITGIEFGRRLRSRQVSFRLH